MRDLAEDAELFAVSERSFVDDETGPTTVEQRAVYRLGCGHVAGFQGPAELSATCAVCGTTICHRCENLRCARCLGMVCTRDARWWGQQVFCPACRRVEIAKWLSLGALFGLARVTGLGVVWLFRGIGALLLAIHRILSKEL
jgi:hypothetical protein